VTGFALALVLIGSVRGDNIGVTRFVFNEMYGFSERPPFCGEELRTCPAKNSYQRLLQEFPPRVVRGTGQQSPKKPPRGVSGRVQLRRNTCVVNALYGFLGAPFGCGRIRSDHYEL